MCKKKKPRSEFQVELFYLLEPLCQYLFFLLHYNSHIKQINLLPGCKETMDVNQFQRNPQYLHETMR